MCKKWLMLLAGVALILVSAGILEFDPWLILGLLFALKGLMPMLCKCESCCDIKKKK